MSEIEVKLKVSRGGIDFSQKPGDKVHIEKAEAIRMLNAGQCELVNPRDLETAAEKPAENATTKKSTKKKSKTEK